MKKTTQILVIIFFILPCISKAQKRFDAQKLRGYKTYADAVELSQMFEKINDSTITNDAKSEFQKDFFTKLRFYNWDINDSTNYIFTDMLKLNNYKVIIPDFTPIKHGPGLSVSQEQNFDSFIYESKSSSEPSVGNLESMAINAIATFMAKRAKEEVMYYAIDDIFDIINDKSTGALVFQKLFPNTVQLVTTLKNSGVYYYADFTILKQTVEADLHNLPTTFYNCIPDNQTTIKDGLYIAGQTYKAITKGEKITDYINTLGTSDAIWKTPQCKSVSHILQLMSNAFSSTSGSSKYWISNSEIADLDPSLFNVNIKQQFFYGLLIQQIKAQPELSTVFNDLTNTANIASFIQNIYTLKELSQELNTLKDSINKIPVRPDFNWYINITNQAVDLIRNTNNRAAEMLGDSIIPNSVFLNANKLLEIAKYISQKQYVEATSIVVNNLIEYDLINSQILRKFNFFIQIANLKDEQGVSNFLEQYTAPIGTSSLKRKSHSNISLNGYVGLNVFSEWIEKNKTSTVAGVFAPIGISYSHSFFNSVGNHAGSITIHLSVFDFGSMVNVRLKDDTVVYSGLKFEQFFSPGIGIFWNLPKSPISIGPYVCHINKLREITYKDGTAVENGNKKNVWRAGATLLIDIPFYTFHNKPQIE